ncbi:MAG: hypothetical protein JO209_00275 [Acidisphaera sp.]|nr:hypothetical protein [Acidisphaera sp.]
MSETGIDLHPGDVALQKLDDALAHQPEKGMHDFAVAVESLCVLRDALIRRRRAGDTDALQHCLDRLNGVISVVVGSEYPLPSVRWDRVAKARGVLAELVADFKQHT